MTTPDASEMPHQAPPEPDCQQPIFIVGPPRSGTTLAARVLSSHPSMQITEETHYFDDLRTHMNGRERSGLSEADAGACVQYFCSLSHLPYGLNGDPDKGKISRDELRAAAERIGQGADAFFEAFCTITASRAGKTRWGEKTPRHVFRIAELLKTYPHAKVICLIRDPRAVVASYRDWQKNLKIPQGVPAPIRARMETEFTRKRKSYHPLMTALMWKAAAKTALQARSAQTPQSVYLMKYEDLVSSPAKTLESLCRWIGVPFTKEMGNELPMMNSSYTERFKGTSADASKAMDRWKETLSRNEIAIVQTACRCLMADLGYAKEPVRLSYLAYGWSWASLPIAAWRAVAVNRGRAGRLLPYLYRRIKHAFG